MARGFGDRSLEDVNEHLIKEMFLDPEGSNLEGLEKALEISLKLLRLWWRSEDGNSPPHPSEDQVRKLASDLECTRVEPFTQPYTQLGPCIKALYANIRFNKNNLTNVHPSPLLPAVAASFVTMLQNPNNLSPATSPATTLMEEECVTELANLVGFRSESRLTQPGGNIVSCGTMSNLTALMVAREKAYGKLDRFGRSPFRKRGLFGGPKGLVVASASAHYSIRKAARILGLGESSLIEVPAASEDEILAFEESGTPFRLKPSKESCLETLERIEETATKSGNQHPLLISAVTTLGTINAGTIEPIRPLIDLRKKYGFHLHVDAAIGGLALALEEVREKALGVENADSITMDPHKLGFIQYPCSAILFHDKADRELIATEAPYIDSSAGTIEGSRPGSNSAAFWVALRSLGAEGYGKLIGGCISLTRKLASLLQDAGYQVLNEIDLNTLCFSLYQQGVPRSKMNKLTNDLRSRVVAGGRYLPGKVEDISHIRVRDKPWEAGSKRVRLTGIKVWIMSPYTNEKDLVSFVCELNEKKKQLDL